MKSRVAIVILNWNGIKFLKKFLPTLEKYSTDQNTSIWIADNNSSDNSINYLKKNHKNIKIIILTKNYGYAGGYNKALQQIPADYYILLNSDVEVTQNWINPIIEHLEKNPNIAAAQPKIISYNNKKNFEYAGAAGGYIDKYGYPFCQGRILNTYEEDKGQYNKISEIFWASGACLFIRSKDFLEEKFDDDFFAHMEEIDLCWRLKNKNKKIIYFPKSKIYHVGGGTLPNNSPQKLFLNYRNSLLLLYKNLNTKKLYKILIIRIILDNMSALIYTTKLQISYTLAVYKAHFQFFKLIKKFKPKRKKLQKYNKPNHKEQYQKSIIFAYFFKNIKNFNQLTPK